MTCSAVTYRKIEAPVCVDSRTVYITVEYSRMLSGGTEAQFLQVRLF